MTQNGGQFGAGSIFKTDGSGNNETIQQSCFVQIEGANPAATNLIQASDGKMYGMTSGGGANNSGIIFRFDPVSSAYLKMLDFDGASIGSNPQGSLMQASDGMLYGMTYSGGANGMGTIFRYDLSTSSCSNLIDFSGTSNGSSPQGSLIQGADGFLYGLTTGGGNSNMGVLFQFDPVSLSFVKELDFNGASNGRNPEGSLVQISGGMIYGLSAQGGLHDKGVLFQFDPQTLQYTKELDFSGTGNGETPVGSLILGSDGKLYGTTYAGGSNGTGVLFQYDPAGSSFAKKYDFTGGTNGFSPMSSLVQAADGMLYGMTYQDGVNGQGVIFQYDPALASYSKVFDFDGASGGSQPQGALMLAADARLYGMTYGGGANGVGVLFQLDPASLLFTKKLDFAEATNGSFPFGALMHGADGMCYGLTSGGGANNMGVLFQFDPAASVYTKRMDFAGTANGSNPHGSLMQTTDGKIYGMTYTGGANGMGLIFQFDPLTNICSDLFDFDGTANGSYPFGSLMQASDGKLYGMTYMGGAFNEGVLFQFDPVSAMFLKMHDFSGSADGSNPQGALIQAADGKLYGMTYYGGTANTGVLFQFDPAGSTFVKMVDFTGAVNGSNPIGSLTKASDGMIYGMTYGGGANAIGVLFRLDPVSPVFTKLMDFDGTTYGSNPEGDLIQASDGMLYGVTATGGINNKGVLFQLNPATASFIKTLDFNGADGENPSYTHLLEIAVTIKTEPLSLSNCAGGTLQVPYTISGAFEPSNVFTAQLSDAFGSFVAPLNIGSVATAHPGSINATIPVHCSAGTGYRIRVTADHPPVTGSDNGTDMVIHALPVVTANASSTTVCEGSTVTLTGSGASSYVWSGAVDGIGFVITATNTYTVTGTDVNNCSSSDSRTILVNSLPTVNANTTAATICKGQSTTLTGSGTASAYLWTSGVIDAQSFVPLATSLYTVTGTDGNNCSNTATISITVNTLPDVTTSLSGTTVTSNQSGASYQWLDCNAAKSSLGGATNQSYMSMADGNYAVSITLNGCTDTSACVAVITTDIAGRTGNGGELDVFPNPNNGDFTIAFIPEGTYSILNELGQCVNVFNAGAQQNTWHVSNLSNGAYFLIGYTGNRFVRKKIVVLK